MSRAKKIGGEPSRRNSARWSPDKPDLLGHHHHHWVRTLAVAAGWASRFIDLFSGCGGISCGFRMAGLRPVLAVEKARHEDPNDDTHAERSYRRNFPGVWVHDGGIETLTNQRLLSGLGDERPQVIVGGPPCQAYSRAGRRDPNDPKARMYVEYLRIVAALLPDVVVMENVVEIRSAGGGEFLRDIISGLDSLGYANPSLVPLNSAWYGVPQKRWRAILIANRHGLPNPYPEPLLFDEADFGTVGDAIRDLADLPRDLEWSHDWTVHSGKVVTGLSQLEYGQTLHGYNEAWERLHPDRPAPVVKSNNGGAAVHPWHPRCLSVRELARLQSFPDDFTLRGGVTAERRQVGNAVPPEMAKHIGRAVATLLDAVDGWKDGCGDDGRMGSSPEKLGMSADGGAPSLHYGPSAGSGRTEPMGPGNATDAKAVDVRPASCPHRSDEASQAAARDGGRKKFSMSADAGAPSLHYPIIEAPSAAEPTTDPACGWVRTVDEDGEMAATRPKPPYAYYGGKQHHLHFLREFVPSGYHQYVEPYFGGGALFWSLPPAQIETINDLDRNIANFYRVLRDPVDSNRLELLWDRTEWSRELYEECQEALATGAVEDPVERAWRWLFIARTSFSGKPGQGMCIGPGRTCKTSTLVSTAKLLPVLRDRLRLVQIENEDGIEIISRYGVEGAFVYVDPPYLPETRRSTRCYGHEMTTEQHHDLLEVLAGSPAMIMLSGYPSPLYSTLEDRGWTRFSTVHRTGSFRKGTRSECIWTNYDPPSGGGRRAG